MSGATDDHVAPRDVTARQATTRVQRVADHRRDAVALAQPDGLERRAAAARTRAAGPHATPRRARRSRRRRRPRSRSSSCCAPRARARSRPTTRAGRGRTVRLEARPSPRTADSRSRPRARRSIEKDRPEAVDLARRKAMQRRVVGKGLAGVALDEAREVRELRRGGRRGIAPVDRFLHGLRWIRRLRRRTRRSFESSANRDGRRAPGRWPLRSASRA